MTRNYYYLPENLDLPRMLNESGLAGFAKPIILDKFYYVIDNLYLRYVIRGEDWNTYLPINCRTLRNIVNHRFASKVLKVLIRLKILERSRKGHSNGYFSRKYRFTEQYRTKFKRFPACDVKQLNRIDVHRKKAAIEVTCGNPALALIRKSIEELKFDWESASKLVALNDYSVAFLEEVEPENYQAAAMKEFHRIQKREHVVEAFKNRDFFFHCDKYGRFHHIFTNCPRDLRPFANWKGKALHNIDVSCCHPALATLLYTEDCEEKLRHVELVKNNRIYEFIRNEAGIEVDFNDPVAKKLFKQETFNKVYYGSNYANPCPIELAVMKKYFPKFVYLSQNEKVNHQRDFARKMQKWESDVIIGRVARRFAQNHRGEDVCLISIHDALVTTEKHIKEIEALMKEEFQRLLGFSLTVKCTLLSGNWDGVVLNEAASDFVSGLSEPVAPTVVDPLPIHPEEMGIPSMLVTDEGSRIFAADHHIAYPKFDDV